MSLLEVKQKISSVQLIKKITRAMQLVASVKFQKAQKSLKNQDSYFLILEQIVGDVFGRIENKILQQMFHHDKTKFKNRLIVIITSDLGFCGGFNYNIFRNLMLDYNQKTDKIVVFGKKGKYILEKHEIKAILEFENSHLVHEAIDIIIPNLSIYYEFIHNDYRELIFIYNKYITPVNIKTMRHSAWPIAANDNNKKNNTKTNINQLFESARKRSKENIPIQMIFEPNKIEVAREVFPNYLQIFLYSCLVNSFTSENSMRKTSMDSANKNCQSLIDELILKRNMMRQASITQEILEVVSSFNT